MIFFRQGILPAFGKNSTDQLLKESYTAESRFYFQMRNAGYVVEADIVQAKSTWTAVLPPTVILPLKKLTEDMVSINCTFI
jgi:hypothetical protein